MLKIIPESVDRGSNRHNCLADWNLHYEFEVPSHGFQFLLFSFAIVARILLSSALSVMHLHYQPLVKPFFSLVGLNQSIDPTIWSSRIVHTNELLSFLIHLNPGFLRLRITR